MGKSANDYLYERALKAIQALYEDDTVSPSDTRANLEMLMDELDHMIEALPDDDSDYEDS